MTYGVKVSDLLDDVLEKLVREAIDRALKHRLEWDGEREIREVIKDEALKMAKSDPQIRASIKAQMLKWIGS